MAKPKANQDMRDTHPEKAEAIYKDWATIFAHYLEMAKGGQMSYTEALCRISSESDLMDIQVWDH